MRWQLSLPFGRGRQAERDALRYLKKHGLCLIQRNYACYFGEIDLIMKDQGKIIFIEVRYRSKSLCGSAQETIDYKKKQKLITTANHFLQCTGDRDEHTDINASVICRFDVIAMSSGDDKTIQIDWIKNAFTC